MFVVNIHQMLTDPWLLMSFNFLQFFLKIIKGRPKNSICNMCKL